MSTSSSSSSVPYKYPTQPPDSRISQPHYHKPNAGTSSASAYAYAQQQLKQQARQSQPQSSTSTSVNAGTAPAYTYLPPQVQRQPLAQSRRAPSLLADRAHSIEELAKLAAQEKYDRYADIKQDLRHAEVYLAEGKKDLDAGDLEWAFVNLARTATLVLNKMPTNSGYNEMRQAHRDTLAANGNYCLERMSEIKPKLVDRYELWRQRNPNTKPELDTSRILHAMEARDQEELAIRAQASKEKRAASKEEAARRAHVEEAKQQAEAAFRHSDPPYLSYDVEFRRRQEAARQAAERNTYDDARRTQEEARRKEAEHKSRMTAQAEYSSRQVLDEEAKRLDLERRRREAEEEGRLREEEIARRKQEAARQEQEAATSRKVEELEHRRTLEESRRREQEGIAQRQRDFEAEAHTSRALLQAITPTSVSSFASLSAPPPYVPPSMPPSVSPSMPPSVSSSKPPSNSSSKPPSTSSSVPPSAMTLSMPLHVPLTVPPSVQVHNPAQALSVASSVSSSSSSSSGAHIPTPKQQDALPILPLESPTRETYDDPRQGWHHPQPQHAVTQRAAIRRNSYQPPITTTSPPPRGQPVAIQYPSLMTDHQRTQGYTPSLQSMFSPPIGTVPEGGLLFRPNNPEGPSMHNLPSSPDRPPAHIRHMWEQAGFGYQYANSGSHNKPKPPPAPGDSRILRPEQVRDDAATVIGKELRIVKVPQNILPRFLAVAAVNTARNKETCGLLMGRDSGKEYRITTLLIPKQHATSDTCTMEEEELVSDFADKRSLLTLGWIHTHPTQSCFMSSLDLHTHAAFQRMLPEFFAIVCSPKHVPDCGIFRLTDPPGLKTILNCKEKASFHPHPERPIYTDADKGHVVWVDDTGLEIVDLR